MQLISTRNTANTQDALQAVLQGIAPDGGLYVPASFPHIPMQRLRAIGRMTYPEAAAEVMGCLFDELSPETLSEMTRDAYANFDTPEVLPIRKLGGNEYILELYHGPTLAFKDMALQMLPRLMSAARGEGGREYLILTATSGDTGKAALEGFCDVPGTHIMVFYPDQGVSDMQRLQMVTQEGRNTRVCAVRGNFDDAQTGVKRIFADPTLRETLARANIALSSANSINFGRLAPQVAYYIYACAKLLESGALSEGERANVCVPTGNFGNILAAYYAKRMGAPIGRLICASNKNNVLTDFFDSGIYASRRAFFKTISPSMDILISSNLERLLFEAAGRDSLVTAAYMTELNQTGQYRVRDEIRTMLADEFYADFCDDAHTLSTIRSVHQRYDYLMDPHTAVAQAVYELYAERTGDRVPVLLASTASPFKFAPDVLFALTGQRESDPFRAANGVAHLTGLPVPAAIAALKRKPILHNYLYEKDGLDQAVLDFIQK